jgi:pimeloyl-ACP methyl ester carboxylesterase
MGGYVALEVALRHDKRLAGLVLVNTNARPASPQQRDRGVGLIEEARNGHFDQVVERLSGIVGGSRPEHARVAATMMRDAGADAFIRQQTAVLARKDRRSELPKIAIPTLVIAGDNDLLAPPSVNNEMARLIPNAEFEIFPCGHMSTVEASKEVAETMQGWFERQLSNSAERADE